LTLDELLPLVRDARTAREFCWVVLASVPAREKHRLAREARDALGRTWHNGTLGHYLAPGIAGVRPYREVPPPRPQPTDDFPPAIADPVALVEAAWTEPRVGETQRDAVVRVLVRMVYFNGGRTNLPRGWLPAMLACFRDDARLPTPQVLRWYRSQLQADPMVFARVPGVDLGVLVAIEDRFRT
jgi:hypothetical protein